MLSRMAILWIAMRLVDLFYQPGPPLLSPQMSPLHEFVRLAQGDCHVPQGPAGQADEPA